MVARSTSVPKIASNVENHILCIVIVSCNICMNYVQ
jgi:hypothetical protein